MNDLGSRPENVPDHWEEITPKESVVRVFVDSERVVFDPDEVIFDPVVEIENQNYLKAFVANRFIDMGFPQDQALSAAGF